jgi:putative sterol carrier protein
MNDLNSTILSILTRIRDNVQCQSDIQKLQGEVLQFKITGAEEYRMAFRNGTVELDNEAAPTFRFEGRPEVLSAIFSGKLTPLAAIMTRRVKATLDPIRGPLIGRIFAAALRQPPNGQK